MAIRTSPTLIDLASERPVRLSIFVLLPLLAVIAQFGNSYYNGLPVVYALAFAALMIAYAVAFVRHQLADLHLTRLYDR